MKQHLVTAGLVLLINYLWIYSLREEFKQELHGIAKLNNAQDTQMNELALELKEAVSRIEKACKALEERQTDTYTKLAPLIADPAVLGSWATTSKTGPSASTISRPGEMQFRLENGAGLGSSLYLAPDGLRIENHSTQTMVEISGRGIYAYKPQPGQRLPKVLWQCDFKPQSE